MTLWLIGGGAVLSAWAVLSVMGGELKSRTAELEERHRRRRPSRDEHASK